MRKDLIRLTALGALSGLLAGLVVLMARQMLGRESIFEHVRRMAEVVPGERVSPESDETPPPA